MNLNLNPQNRASQTTSTHVSELAKKAENTPQSPLPKPNETPSTPVSVVVKQSEVPDLQTMNESKDKLDNNKNDFTQSTQQNSLFTALQKSNTSSHPNSTASSDTQSGNLYGKPKNLSVSDVNKVIEPSNASSQTDSIESFTDNNYREEDIPMTRSRSNGLHSSQPQPSPAPDPSLLNTSNNSSQNSEQVSSNTLSSNVTSPQQPNWKQAKTRELTKAEQIEVKKILVNIEKETGSLTKEEVAELTAWISDTFKWADEYQAAISKKTEENTKKGIEIQKLEKSDPETYKAKMAEKLAQDNYIHKQGQQISLKMSQAKESTQVITSRADLAEKTALALLKKDPVLIQLMNKVDPDGFGKLQSTFLKYGSKASDLKQATNIPSSLSSSSQSSNSQIVSTVKDTATELVGSSVVAAASTVGEFIPVVSTLYTLYQVSNLRDKAEELTKIAKIASDLKNDFGEELAITLGSNALVKADDKELLAAIDFASIVPGGQLASATVQTATKCGKFMATQLIKSSKPPKSVLGMSTQQAQALVNWLGAPIKSDNLLRQEALKTTKTTEEMQKKFEELKKSEMDRAIIRKGLGANDDKVDYSKQRKPQNKNDILGRIYALW